MYEKIMREKYEENRWNKRKRLRRKLDNEENQGSIERKYERSMKTVRRNYKASIKNIRRNYEASNSRV